MEAYTAAAHSGYIAGFRLERVYLPEALVIGVVRVRKCFCGVSSASSFARLKPLSFIYIIRRSKHVVQADDKQVWG